ncbi:MAG: NmrA/HSCARG family protein [Deltaproteobacteria bacterium]|nr:NmrA/HSCARG family protein [Deltaproteobacteria bacterium]
MTDKIVLVTGATGRQGGAVANALIDLGFKVKTLVRHADSERAKALSKLGAGVTVGDLDDATSLARALEGAWGVFAVQNTWEAGVEREEEQGKRLARVARERGVKHFVYSSVCSANRATSIPHFENKWRIEEEVRKLDFPSYTILRPVFFMENFCSPWFKPALADGQLTLGVRPDTRLQMIAVGDIGRVGGRAFEEHSRFNRRELALAGDACTMPEAAATLSRALGKAIRFAPTAPAEIRQANPDFAAMLEWFDRVGYDADLTFMRRELGFEATRLAEWARGVTW